MRIAWITDPHFNFVPHDLSADYDCAAGYAKSLGRRFKRETGADAALLTGDLAEFDNFVELVDAFQDGFDAVVYFVLGNHDSYGGSIGEAKRAADRCDAEYIGGKLVLGLADRTALIGVDGWYDGRNGNARTSRVLMSDWHYVAEFMGTLRLSSVTTPKLTDRIRSVADAEAGVADERMREAIKAGFTRIILATHVPPFRESAWHEGKPSDDDWAPWMSSRVMGDTLMQVAAEHPEVSIEVYCGHTHGRGVYRPARNLVVHTGESEYYAPRVSGIIEVPE